MEVQSGTVHRLSLRRLERMTDICYAFALLVLVYIFTDAPDNLTAKERWEFYLSHIQVFTGFVISFLIVVNYWLNHQEYFSYFTGTNKAHTMIELVYLLFLIFTPFWNNFFNQYADAIEPRVILSIDMVFLGLLQYASWRYATKKRRLIGEQDPDDERIKAVGRSMLFMPLVAIIAAAVAYIYVYLWDIVLIALPLALTLKKKKGNG